MKSTKTTNPTTTATTTVVDETKVKAIIADASISKSEAMRRMYDLGCEIGFIAEKMNTRYNFVYNVVSQACRNAGVEIRTSVKGESRKDQIIAALKDGKTPVEVSKLLQCNINMVYKYRKEMEAGLID